MAVIRQYILNDLREAEEEAVNGNVRQMFKRLDSYELHDKKFMKLLRVNKVTARDITELLQPFLQHPTRQSAIPVDVKVLIALHFFGCGSYQEGIGKNLFTSISQATVSRCINEVATALNRADIMQQFIHFPHNMEELRTLRQRFYRQYQFPGIVGVIDCTHIAIVAPTEEEHIYINRKNYHSLNVQLICDNELRIMHVNARFPGSSHDSYIWRQSNISNTMENIHRHHNNDNFYLLADSGYPLRPWLLTPLEEAPQPGTAGARFQERFKSIRSIIEPCNGLLKNRFRCLLKHRVLHYAPEVADKIVNACVLLHNICINNNVPIIDDDEVEGTIDWGIIQHQPNQALPVIGRVNPDLAAARNLRRIIINNHFQLL